MIVRSILENFDPENFDYPNDYSDTMRWLRLMSIGGEGRDFTAIMAALDVGRMNYLGRRTRRDGVVITDDIAQKMGEFRVRELFDLAAEVESLGANGMSNAEIGRAMAADLVVAFLHAMMALRCEYDYHIKSKPIMDSIQSLIDGDSHDELGSFLSEVHGYLANLTIL